MRTRTAAVLIAAGSAAAALLATFLGVGGGSSTPDVAPRPALEVEVRGHATIELETDDGSAEPARPSERDASVAAVEEEARDVPKPAARAASERKAGRVRLEGFVRDVDTGAGVAGVELLVQGTGDAERTESDGSGRVSASADADVALTLELRPPDGWVAVEDSPVELPPQPAGSTWPLDLRVRRWPPEVAGDIRGVLQSERGPWPEEELPEPDEIVLDLISTAEPRIALRGEIQVERDGRGGHWLSFVFADVPRTEYELTLSSLDAYRWHPTSIFVTPPANGIAFLRYDLDRMRALAFRVIDARTGERIEEYDVRSLKVTASAENGVLLHTGPLELASVPVDAAFGWSLWADGYAPAFGDESSFVREGEREVAEVRLEHGWGTRFLVMGGKGTKRLIEGATIWVDGELAGTTGPDGTLDIRRSASPDAVDVRYLDWKLDRDPLEIYGGRPPEARGQVTPVLLEPPR